MILVKSPTFGNRSLGLTLLLSLALLGRTSATVAGEGACCFPDDICVEGVDDADCDLIGGFYLGDGSACDGDEDGDGVVGCDDLCPGTPSGTPVDGNGCPTIGACCFADVGVCLDGLDEDTCVSIDGDYVGGGSFCDDPDACPPICEGDANGDGLVDPLDSGYVLARFGCPVGTGDLSCDDADQNGDGLVDPLDSGFVLARFGDCPKAPPECSKDADCDDGDVCTTDSCDDATGECTNDPLECPAGQTCDPASGDCVDVPCTVDEDCDDGVACTIDICAAGMCGFTPNNFACEDGLFCTGDGTCDPEDEDADADGCVFTGDPCDGTTPNCDEANNECDACVDDADCDDDVSCTDDTCEVDGSCTNAANDGNCSDPDFCDGVDACDPANDDADAEGCVAPGNPCTNPTPVCEESDDSCSACVSNTDCDDDVSCTDDTCDGGTGACTNTADDANCADPDFCDGVDTCTPADPDADANGCLAPGDPCSNPDPICDEVDDVCNPCMANADCDDGVDCTDDTCNGTTGDCVFTDNCTGGLMCLGGADPTICD